MMEHVGDHAGIVAKNLFFRDKKKKCHWVLTARHDRPINLNELGKQLEAKGGIRLADAEVLQEKLGVGQGCVTPFALINDVNHQVVFVIDDDLLNGSHEKILIHPLVNSATTAIAPDDLIKFLDSTGHTPVRLSF